MKKKNPKSEQENHTIFDMIIPRNVESKIRHLCSIIHDVEWSGVLFYTPEGSLDDGTFKVTCKDIFVMDVGSSTYTEYNDSPDILTYRVHHDLLDPSIQEGLIHSHNNMAAFFSGTDVSTLKENGEKMNHFVSLIVNNAGNYVARVTRRIIKESQIEADIKYVDNTYYNTYNGEKVIIEEATEREETKKGSKKEENVEWFDFNIIKEAVFNDFSELDTRIHEIKKSKSKTIVSKDYYKGGSKESYPKLFDDYDYRYSKHHDYSDYSANYPYYYSGLTKPVKEDFTFNKTAIQLITGSIIPRNFTKDQLDNWVKVMDTKWEEAIGPFIKENNPGISAETLEENKKRLNFWIETMIEIFLYEDDKDLEVELHKEFPSSNITEDDVASVKAQDILQSLNKLGDSYVLNEIKECLINYI